MSKGYRMTIKKSLKNKTNDNERSNINPEYLSNI